MFIFEMGNRKESNSSGSLCYFNLINPLISLAPKNEIFSAAAMNMFNIIVTTCIGLGEC